MLRFKLCKFLLNTVAPKEFLFKKIYFSVVCSWLIKMLILNESVKVKNDETSEIQLLDLRKPLCRRESELCCISTLKNYI